MKRTLVLALSFFAFFTNLPLGFSDDAEQVVDKDGDPLEPSRQYYIFPSFFGPAGGGVKYARTANSECPLTVFQEYSQFYRGNPVKFTVAGDTDTSDIFTGTEVEIEFVDKPRCAESSKWTESAQACLNIERFDAYNGEEGRRLTLTEEEYGASDIVFIRAYDDDDDKVIKSVV
ncbi:Kunitz inhibitor ST1-like [Vigna unguiculata]|uniref:Kunitz inhibitor ST1-like n=1 Tax=Vigna unguiculata TaxID=3917 RepID=A0A4D6M1V3_VIGUN|nr:Kunitz inhibitor ST1-like [Vigna unguiculata]